MMVKLSAIKKNYSLGDIPVRALKNIDLEVREGEYLAVLGASGSGKSTLMNILGCLDTRNSGTYLLDGSDVSRLEDREMALIRNKMLGFVFQNFYLLDDYSALENAALPLLYSGICREQRRAVAREALERVGLGDSIDFSPGQLSCGQRQRVAIARAIVNRPRMLLADEPTGALDSVTGGQLLDIFDELHSEGVTIIMITHERDIARRAARVIYIKDGMLSDTEA